MSDRLTLRVGSLLFTLTHQEALDLEQHLHEALRRYERRNERDVDQTVDMGANGSIRRAAEEA